MIRQKLKLIILILMLLPKYVFAQSMNLARPAIYLIKIASYLIIFALVAILSKVITKYIARNLNDLNNKSAKVLDKIILNQNLKIYTLKLYGHIYIIGESNNNIILIDKQVLKGDLKEELEDLEEKLDIEQNNKFMSELDLLVKRIGKNENNE